MVRCLFVAFLAGLGGCHSIPWPDALAQGPQQQIKRLAGTTWRADDIGGAGVLEGTESTLEFDAKARAAGHTGCNVYVSEVAFGSRRYIQFSEVMKAEMDCPAEFLEQEKNYERALTAARKFRIERDHLVLLDESGKVVMRMIRVPRLRWS